MKLGFCGNGGMGKVMQEIAMTRHHEVVSVVEKNDDFDFGAAEIVFEATNPSVVVKNIERLCAQKKDIIIVTTGWYEQMKKVKKIVESSGNRVLWSSNFSIGVNLYFRIIESAAQLFENAEEFDVWGTEIHHHQKVDSPSGTAKTIEKILLQNISRKTKIVEAKLDRKILPEEIHFSSTRGGACNFGHTVTFDAEADFIKLEHFARNRDGYALGAIKAAEWLAQQPQGFYSMDDFFECVFAKNF